MNVKKAINPVSVLGIASACFAGSAFAAPLSINNAGFETDVAPTDGATGWTINSGGTDWFTSTAGAPDSAVDPDAAAEGVNWLSSNRLVTGAGSSNDPQVISQLVDITADAALIASGGAFVSLDFMFADNDGNDEGTVNINFFSDLAGTASVGTGLTTGVLADTGPLDNTPAPWVAQNLTGAVPVGAQSMLIEIVNARTGGGSAGNTHFDALRGEITDVPEPASLLVLGLSGLAVLGRRSASHA